MWPLTVHIEEACAGYTGDFDRVFPGIFDLRTTNDKLIAIFLVLEFVFGRRE